MYTPHVLVTFGGQLNEHGSFDEIWQCGIRCAVADGFDEHTYVEEVADHLAAWFTDGSTKIPPYVHLNWLKAARIAADGNYPTPTYAPAEALYASPPGGSGGAPYLPSFCSVAYSWLSSDHRRGPASRGRIYPPNFSVPLVAGTSSVATADCVTAAAQAHKLLLAIQNADGADICSPGIYSKVDGTASVITSIRVGDVIDTQRRRKLKHPEVYSALAFP